MRIAHVVVDIPTMDIDEPFDYLIADDSADIGVGSCVVVEFGHRSVVGWVVGVSEKSSVKALKPIDDVFERDVFSAVSVELARWIASEYLCPLSEALRLFTPPSGTPKARKTGSGDAAVWELVRPGVGPVDDRWAELGDGTVELRANASMQRAVMDALSQGPVRVAELTAGLGSVDSALKTLEARGAVRTWRERRYRDPGGKSRPAPRPEELTAGQRDALDAISSAEPGSTVVLEGVTGSGKTEVYLQAIEQCRLQGRAACVLVPEISLTPQTVGRFRSRFGDEIAVLHSRLSVGERYDQWDRIRRGETSIVVGARSALFAPLKNTGLIVIDEEHESSYKQGQSPRYHARDVAERLAQLTGARLVLGSASPSMETIHQCDKGRWRRVLLPQRVAGRSLPVCEVVDMTREFADGHRSMFSRPLVAALERARAGGSKAVLFLNRRGFASFLLCRECGFVPTCESCSTSLTYHEVGESLVCHHCGSTRDVPAVCPSCSSPYLKRFGAGTQRVETELQALMPGWPIVRMDADTATGKGAHERILATFEALDSGVLLGTQMIAKGLDYPDVTVVGVISADITLNLPDFRAAERTYQLLEQVAGRAGRGDQAGEVVIQTYWPEHPAVLAAATHDPRAFYAEESRTRKELGYPPFGRLVNVLVWGRDKKSVAEAAGEAAKALIARVPDGVSVLGPSPAPLARLKGVWRWHVLVKGEHAIDLPSCLREAMSTLRRVEGVTVAVDIDPVDLL